MRAAAAIALSLITTSTVAAPPSAPPPPRFSQVYVFGDSAVDAGNWNLSPPLPPKDAPYYFRGRFSNDYTWADRVTLAVTGHLSRASGPFAPPYLPDSAPFRPAGENYAYGGAVTGAGPDLPPPVVPSMTTQVAAFLHAIQPEPDALVLLSGGGNDYIARDLASSGTSDVDVASAATARIAALVRRLYAAGARNFLVNTSDEAAPQPPPGGFQPLLRDALDDAARDLPGLRVAQLDTSAVFAAVLRDPAAYGVTDTVRDCFRFDPAAPAFQPFTYDPAAPAPAIDDPALYTTPGTCADVSRHLRVDGLHDTSAVQAAIAQAAIALLAIRVAPGEPPGEPKGSQ